MNTHQLLDQHPSVQALNIANNTVNTTKAQAHARTINARPFTTASAVLAAHKGGRKEEKGNRVTVVRNEQAIQAAAVAAAAAQREGKFRVTTTTKLAGIRGLPTKAAAAEAPVEPANPPPKSSASPKQPLHGSTGRVRPVAGRSLVSSAPSSFDASSSHADSYSDYSCSCCHPQKAPSSKASYSSAAINSKLSTAPSAFSSTSVPLSAYENMTSISERIAKQQHGNATGPGVSTGARPPAKSQASAPSGLTATSMASSKLKALECELQQEREHRKMTEDELAAIKARQELLLSKLSEKDRDEVRRLVGEQQKPRSNASAGAR